MKFTYDTHVSRETILRFETVRSVLGHEGRMTPADLGTIFCMGKDYSDLDPTASGPETVRTPWELAAYRYDQIIREYSEQDLVAGGVGVSGPGYYWVRGLYQDRGLLIHRTCTCNTVLVCNEHLITGWSWTRTEIAGVSLVFGPPPEWLTAALGWQSEIVPIFVPESEQIRTILTEAFSILSHKFGRTYFCRVLNSPPDPDTLHKALTSGADINGLEMTGSRLWAAEMANDSGGAVDAAWAWTAAGEWSIEEAKVFLARVTAA